MRIENTPPPNYEEIAAVFPAVADSQSAVFTYGETIHNPHGVNIRPDLELHESVHTEQQKGKPKEWWDRFLSDPEFRLSQELEAFAKQYQYARTILSSARAKIVLHYLALDLSSAEYGNLVSYQRAESLIRSYAVV